MQELEELGYGEAEVFPAFSMPQGFVPPLAAASEASEIKIFWRSRPEPCTLGVISQ
jgi:hypothetical protein